MKLNDALKKLDKCLIQVEWHKQCLKTIERNPTYITIYSKQRQLADTALTKDKLKKANHDLKNQSELVIGLLIKLKDGL